MREGFAEGTNSLAPRRTLHQIVDDGGKGLKAFAAQNLWIGANQHFTPPRAGNTVTPYTTGEAYFKRIYDAIKSAKSEVWISGWQINWDVLLVPGERLFDALLEAARRNVYIYVMPWAGAGAVPTYVNETGLAFLLINNSLKSPRVYFLKAKSLADESRIFFSHHQKHVVIDRKFAFVGGIDLAYGRRDDANFDLRADAKGRHSLDRYNGCIAHVILENGAGVLDPLNLTNLNEHSIVNHREQDFFTKISDRKYRQASTSFGGHTLDPKCQPRMPWQDTHVEIVGPAALDVALNFCLRWNSEGGRPKLELPSAASKALPQGSCTVQVLRSAPFTMCEAELKDLTAQQKAEYFGHANKKHNREDNICQAMLGLIARSQHYIYIENQFFVSAFGEDSGKNQSISGPLSYLQAQKTFFDNRKASLTHVIPGNGDATVKNRICFALGERIGRAILTNGHKPFHVIIVLPVHPEGPLNDPGLMLQVHQTMQTLVFGEFSLINQIRRHLKARQLIDKKDANYAAAYVGDAYKSIDVKACEEYLTLLNLRNWEKVGERYVTEQVYVHNKMMIVDDLFAIIGSANINERSMLGSRDSELAVLVADQKSEECDIDGTGKTATTRMFARELRMGVWNKIFGLTAGGAKAAASLKFAVDQPANPSAWKEIRKVASANSRLYEAAFEFIPRNSVVRKGVIHSASIWPNWDPQAEVPNLMPFDDAFWAEPRFNPAAAANLGSVKGFITLLPLNWTRGENNLSSFHSALYSGVEKHQPVGSGPSPDESLAAISNPSESNNG